MVDIDQTWKLSDRGTIASQLIGMNDLRDIVFTQDPDQKGLCNLSIAVALEEDIEHETVLVHCSPTVKRAQARCSDQDKPMSDAIDARTHLIRIPDDQLYVMTLLTPLIEHRKPIV